MTLNQDFQKAFEAWDELDREIGIDKIAVELLSSSEFILGWIKIHRKEKNRDKLLAKFEEIFNEMAHEPTERII